MHSMCGSGYGLKTCPGIRPILGQPIFHVLFTLFVGFFAHSGVQHILCCVFCFVFFSSCVPYVASFSALSIFGCPFDVP